MLADVVAVAVASVVAVAVAVAVVFCVCCCVVVVAMSLALRRVLPESPVLHETHGRPVLHGSLGRSGALENRERGERAHSLRLEAQTHCQQVQTSELGIQI